MLEIKNTVIAMKLISRLDTAEKKKNLWTWEYLNEVSKIKKLREQRLKRNRKEYPRIMA